MSLVGSHSPFQHVDVLNLPGRSKSLYHGVALRPPHDVAVETPVPTAVLDEEHLGRVRRLLLYIAGEHVEGHGHFTKALDLEEVRGLSFFPIVESLVVVVVVVVVVCVCVCVCMCVCVCLVVVCCVVLCCDMFC